MDDKLPADMAPPFLFAPRHKNPYEDYMLKLIGETNSVIYMDEMKNFIIRGDGVRLHIPFDWLIMALEEDLYIAVINGIRVSLDNQERLGY